MFVKENATIDIKIYYSKLPHGYMACTEAEFNKLSDDKKEKYESLNVKMKEMTWGLYNELQESGLVENESGDRHFHFKQFKESRLKKLIKEWDAKDENDKVVPVSENMILHLAPSIAEAILRAYDEVSFMSPETEGNL